MPTIELTKHGKKRLRERLGLPTKAIKRHLEKIIARATLFYEDGKNQKFVDGDNLYLFFKKEATLIFCTILQSKEHNFSLYVGGEKRKVSAKSKFNY